jgi:phage-related protein
VADILAKAANDSAAGVGDMQYAFKYAAAPAHALGLSIEELSAATEIMANAGIKGETAGTSLRAALLRLVKPPKQAREALDKLGVKIKDSHGKMLPLSNIIGQLNEKTKGMANAQKTAALSAIFGTEAVSGMLALVNAGAPQIDKFTKSLKDSDGASAEAAKKMKDNLKGALQQLQGAFESAQITIGEALAPSINKVASGLKTITNAFNGLSPGMQKFIAIGGAVTAIVLAIVTALGFIVMAIGGVISAWAAISVAMAPIGAVIMSSILPIVGIIAGIAGAAVLLYKAWQTNFGGIRDFTSNVWNLIVQKFNEVKAFVMPIISQLVSYISERWKTIAPMVSQVMDFIGQVIKFILPFVFDTIKFYLDAIINVFKGAFNIIAGVIKFFVALFSGDWKGMWEALKQVLLGAVQAIWGLFNLWFVGKIAGVIGSFINKGIGFFAKFAADGVAWIGKFVAEGFSRIASFGTNIVSKIGTVMADFGGVIAKWLAKALKSYIDFVVSVIKTLGSIVGQVADIGVNIVKGIWSGISSMGSWLVKQLSKWALAVIPGPIAKALGIHSPSRLMRDQIGKWIPAGVADGITGNLGIIKSAVNQMSLATIPTSIPATSIPQYSSSGAMPVSTVPAAQPVIIENVMYLDSEIIGKGTSSVIDTQQNTRLQTKLLLNGVR